MKWSNHVGEAAGFIPELIHMWVPALQTVSSEWEWFITKGRPLPVSVLLGCFCLMLVGYLLSVSFELLYL